LLQRSLVIGAARRTVLSIHSVHPSRLACGMNGIRIKQ
jgi:hypothetical protein